MRNFEAITLSDDRSGTRARIVPDLGFNCYSFEASRDGQPCELLWSAAGFLSGTQKPSRSGIPVLFPFAGRIRGTEFEFDGDTYTLPVGDDFGNAIHGFVFNRPWRVIDHQPNRATGEFQASLDDPAVLSQWPADFRIRTTYILSKNRLELKVEIGNPDNRPLPFWFGIHPYFRVPLWEGSEGADCRVTVPAASYWELAELLPTGRILPVDEHRDLRNGCPFGNLAIDDILCNLQPAGSIYQASIDDPRSQCTLRISFASEFDACVVFTPPHREAICIEPYTSISNAFELERAGVKTGMRLLAPSEAFHCAITMEFEQVQGPKK